LFFFEKNLDFEKDEEGNENKIDVTAVFGFLWQIMLQYKNLHFGKSEKSTSSNNLTKEEIYLMQLQRYIAKEYIGNVWLIREPENQLISKYPFQKNFFLYISIKLTYFFFI
jgi:hypothetical protein